MLWVRRHDHARFVCLCLWLCCGVGQDAKASRRSYEGGLVRRALKKLGLKPDPKPEGKRIAKIVIFRENVIGPADPWPLWLNVVHVKTRDSIVRQEILLRPGQVWVPARIAESERNLRIIPSFAITKVLACRAKKAGQVILLVVTKDLWSLRVNFNLSLNGLLLTGLLLNPSELNFLGRAKQIGLDFRISQFDLRSFELRDSITMSQYYFDRRLFGTRLQFYERAGILIDGHLPCGGAIGTRNDVWCPTQGTGSVSGGFAQLQLTRPLFALSSKWAFKLFGYFERYLLRSFRQNRSDEPAPPGEQQGVSLRTVQYEHSDGRLRVIPRLFEDRYLTFSASLTRSYGSVWKHDFSGGAVFYQQIYSLPESFPFDEQTRRWFIRQVVPRSETVLYTYLSYRLRPTRFIRRRNIQTFALTEDYTLGPKLRLEARAALNLEQSTQYFTVFQYDASWRWLWGENLFRLSSSGSARWQPRINEVGFAGPWVNVGWTGLIHNISPLWKIGRLHTRVALLLRYRDLNRNVAVLGGNSGLRGFPDNQFEGQNSFKTNIEFRTLPIDLFTVHLGAVVFYDGGALFGGSDPRRPEQPLPFIYRQSVGVGIRFLLPQFNRSVFRVDMGVPLSAGQGEFGTWFSLALGQVF